MNRSALLAGWLCALSLGFSHAEDAAGNTFQPAGSELATICTGDARVSADGVLVWKVSDDQAGDSHDAPYQLACPEFTLSNDGQTLRVQAASLELALQRFDPHASFLVYFADLTVRFPEPGQLSADATDSVPEAELSDVARVTVTASQSGQADRVLITNGQLTLLTYNPAVPLTVHVRANGSPVEWPEVTVEANSGRITAPLPRHWPRQWRCPDEQERPSAPVLSGR